MLAKQRFHMGYVEEVTQEENGTHADPARRDRVR
jgi:hypothetical protein